MTASASSTAPICTRPTAAGSRVTAASRRARRRSSRARMRMRREAAVFASVSSLFGLITPRRPSWSSAAQPGAERRARRAAVRGVRDLSRAGRRTADLVRARGVPAGRAAGRRRIARRALPRLQRRAGHGPARAAHAGVHECAVVRGRRARTAPGAAGSPRRRDAGGGCARCGRFAAREHPPHAVLRGRTSIAAPSCATIPRGSPRRAPIRPRVTCSARGAAQLVTSGEARRSRSSQAITRWSRAARRADLTLLGWFRGERAACWSSSRPGAAARCACPRGTRTARAAAARAACCPPDSASLLAYARALALWRARHRHCGVCGAPNVPARAGHVMRCSRAGVRHRDFPAHRSRDHRAGLRRTANARCSAGRRPGRRAAIPPSLDSSSPAKASKTPSCAKWTRRLACRSCASRYDSSQPWPFPVLADDRLSRRRAHAGITLRDGELEDARWFTRAEIAAGHPGHCRPPARFPRGSSIAGSTPGSTAAPGS